MNDLQLIDFLIGEKVVNDRCRISSIEMVFELVFNMNKRSIKILQELTHEYYINYSNELVVQRKDKKLK